MYEENIAVAERLVREHAVIRHVSKHRNPDGSFDVAGNLKLWADAMAQFIKIPLWERGAPDFDDRDPLQEQPYMVLLPQPDAGKPVSAVIVAHGGGFQTRTGCEGLNVGWYFWKQGFAVAILTYRLLPYTRHHCIMDMQRAIRVLRCRREELGLDGRVACMGFSAGGMLSSNCATHYDLGDPGAPDPVERESCRPDAAVVGYGALSRVAFPKMFFERPDPMDGVDLADQVYLAPDMNLTVDTPPFFVWQTLSDDGRYGINLARRLNDYGIPYELHIFQTGMHGIAMADGENDLSAADAHVAHWGTLCAEWMRTNGLASR